MAPFVFFVLSQIRRRSIEDLLNTTMGLLKSLITAAVFQVYILSPSFFFFFLKKVGFTPDLSVLAICVGLAEMVDWRSTPSFL